MLVSCHMCDRKFHRREKNLTYEKDDSVLPPPLYLMLEKPISFGYCVPHKLRPIRITEIPEMFKLICCEQF